MIKKTYRKLINWFTSHPRWSTLCGSLTALAYAVSIPQPEVVGINLAWAVAIPAGASIVGGYLSKKGADKAADASQLGAKLTEQARQEAKRYVEPGNIYKMSQWMFPGLLPDPKSKSSNQVGGQAYFSDPYQSTGDPKEHAKVSDLKQALVNAQNMPSHGIWKGLQEKAVSQAQSDLTDYAASQINPDPPQMAQGGQLQAGQTAIVGEQGPELFQPAQAGTVVPNQGIVSGPGGGGGVTIPPPQPGVPGPTQPDPVISQEDTYGTSPNQVWAGGAAPTPASYGEMAVQAGQNFLENPGQLDTTSYERTQEQINQGLQTNTQALMGALTGMGVDPRSGLGQTMLQSATRQSNIMRNEASRNLVQQEEALRRTDIQTGMTAYQNFLNQVFGIVGTQAGVAGQAGFPSTPAINPYEGIATAITAGGSMFGDYFANKNKPQPNYTEGGG